MRDCRNIRGGLVALFIAIAGGPALAQQDVQITPDAIRRTCAEIHRTPQVEVEAPTVRGPKDVTLNCRLVGAAGSTIAQILPAEVCQRLNGSTDWYSGMGTQMFCRGGTNSTPAPRSFTVNADDIAKACQRNHSPQASAEAAAVGPGGLELNCRLPNNTYARISPEDVCEAKFGTRGWMGVAGSTTFVCKGDSPETEASTKPVTDGASPAAERFNDVPLTLEAMSRGCAVLHGPDATAAPLTYARTALHTTGHEPIINCNTNAGAVAHKASEFCPKLSGTGEWYLTDFGRGTWLVGETPGSAPRIHVCRGPGPLQYHALADIGRYCSGKGYRYAHYGTTLNRPPFCSHGAGSAVSVTIADVCRDVHRAKASEHRGVVYFCLPEGAPAPAVAEPKTPVASPCPDCEPLMKAIGHYEGEIAEQKRRIATEERYKRDNEEGAKRRTGREREGWEDAARAAAARIEGIKQLQARMEAELAARKAQLTERIGRCAEPGCREVVSSVRPDLVPALPTRPTTTERSPTTERPPATEQQPPVRTTERPPVQTTERTPSPRDPTTTGLAGTPQKKEAGASSSSKGPCDDHVAELTNGQRVFHRLYVIGEPNGAEAAAWFNDVNLLAHTLTSPGRQKLGSTSTLLEQPTNAQFKLEIERLKKVALPCDEVTIFLTGHGGGGEEHGVTPDNLKAKGEKYGEAFKMRRKSDDDRSYLFDKDMGEMMKGFKPNVSVTMILSVCFGGGFVGPGNIEQSDLVKVIGLYNVCPGDGSFDKAIRDGIDEGASKNTDARVTADELKAYLMRDRWLLGAPFDDSRDSKEMSRLPPTGQERSR